MSNVNKAIPTIEIFAAFAKWINQRSGIDYGNYGEPTSFRAEQRTITNQKKRALKALEAAQNFPFDAQAMAEALERNFSGRLSWINVNYKIKQKGKMPVEEVRQEFDYCVGQYFVTEYRLAAAVVLEAYVHAVTPKVLPSAYDKFTSIKDIERASLASGSFWFSKDNMKAFRTRLESEVYPQEDGTIRFITSEEDWDGNRAFSVRSFDPKDAGIDTVSDYHEYATKADAIKAAKSVKVGA
jgi:hypothetical protein